MKTININKLLVIAFLAVTTMVSCTDSFFDVKPADRPTEDSFYKTEADIDLAMTACYKGWEGTSGLWMDMAAGNGFSQFSWDGYQAFGNGSLNASSDFADFWKYDQITKYNKVLSKIDGIPMNDAKRDLYKVELRFLRAYDYFKKVYLYGDCPLVTTTFTAPSEANLPRDPAAKVKEFIFNELKAIIESEILPVKNDIDAGGHVNRGAAYALQARMHLFEGNYAEAMVSAKKVIDMPCFELFTNSFLGVFQEANEGINKETILAVQYEPINSRHSIWTHTMPDAQGGWSSVNVSKNLVDAYEMDNGLPITDPASGYNEDTQFENRDPRLAMTVLYPGQYFYGRYFNPMGDGADDWNKSNNPRTGLGMKKYIIDGIPSSDLGRSGANVPIFRLAEMYLTYAEAAEKAGTAAEKDLALQYINKIRDRAGHVPAPALTEDLVRRERRIELCFEGLWWHDVRRWGLGPIELGQPLYGAGAGSVNLTTGVVTWDKDNNGKIKYKLLEQRTFLPERNYLLMIPQYELDANPNIKINNPGY